SESAKSMTSSNSRREGAASAAPSSARRKRRKRGGDFTVTAKSRSVLHRADVINWVRSKSRAGVPTKEMVELSKTADDWPPGPSQPLSDGSLASCFAVIHHLEAQGVRWPLEEEGHALRDRKGPTRTGKRLRHVTTARKAVLQAGKD